MKKQQQEFQLETITLGAYAAVVYEHSWWISVVTEVNQVECDVKVKFLHPKGPSTYFNWPQCEYYCYIANINILKQISVPQASSSSGRNYILDKTKVKEIRQKWDQYCKSIDV